MRPLLLSVAGLGLLAVAAGATWWQGGPVAEPAPELASTVQETPDAEHEVLTPDGEPAMVEIIGERHVAAPGDNRVALNTGKNLAGVGHLRHPFGRHKAAGFNFCQACFGQAFNQFNFCSSCF